jgi:hypothetical protein
MVSICAGRSSPNWEITSTEQELIEAAGGVVDADAFERLVALWVNGQLALACYEATGRAPACR